MSYQVKVLKFGSETCSGCVVMRPRWKKVESSDYLNSNQEGSWLISEYYEFYEEKARPTFEKYGVVSEDGQADLPVFIFLDNQGSEFARKVGEVSVEEILKIFRDYFVTKNIAVPTNLQKCLKEKDSKSQGFLEKAKSFLGL
jgi:hypothetical protein